MSTQRFPFRPLHTTLLAVYLLQNAAVAGDLNAEIERMYNDLGAIGNYTAPGAFRGQVYNTYTGGSLILRSPNKVYQLAAIQFPNAKGGCGGIDVFGGSFSHISSTEFKNMLRNITAALPGVAFQLALDSITPLLGSVSKWTKSIETFVNNRNINTCTTAKALVSTAAEATGYSSQEACADLAVELGLESDREAAQLRCKTNRPGVLATARSSSDPNVRNRAPFVGNYTWKALKLAGPDIDDKERELIMSLVGTVIFYAEEEQRDPATFEPTITSISQLLYGQGDAADGRVVQHLLRCNNYSECDQVRVDTNYLHVPLTHKVEMLMHSIARKISTRTPILNPSREIGFINQTTEPVYRMMSIGSAIPGTIMADHLIKEYRDVVAADYAYVFLEKNLRVGIAALNKTFLLDQPKLDMVQRISTNTRLVLEHLAVEKQTLQQKVVAFNAVAANLEALARDLVTYMPKNVYDALSWQAANNLY